MEINIIKVDEKIREAEEELEKLKTSYQLVMNEKYGDCIDTDQANFEAGRISVLNEIVRGRFKWMKQKE